MMTVAFIGLGLIGGSLAKATSRFTAHKILGYDINEKVVASALADRVIDEAYDPTSPADADIVVLALTPDNAIETAEKLFPLLKKGTVAVDICGIKRKVCSALTPLALKYGVSYVGGHPMAGIERSGYENSSPNMFIGASMILCPQECSDESSVGLLKEYFLSLKFSGIKITTPELHDRVIAYTSQLAHIVSSAYIKSPTAPLHDGLAGGSFKDMTRVATLDENMWTELFLENRVPLLYEVNEIIDRLSEYRDALEKSDSETLKKLLLDGKTAKKLTSEKDTI